MASQFVSTIFSPQTSCVASSNLWLRSTSCVKLPYADSQTVSCTYFFHGNPWTSQATPTSNACYSKYDATIAYTACPVGYTGVHTTSYGMRDYVEALTYCCPAAYSYDRDIRPINTFFDGQPASLTWNDKPHCKATSVEVLISKIVTVTLASTPEVSTTTLEWNNDAQLFAEIQIVRAYVYRAPEGRSTCWGARCPMSYEPTPSFPATITPTPSARFTHPPECLDTKNMWVLTTSCYITSPAYAQSTPDWLTCSVTHFGAPAWTDASCRMSSKTVVGDATTFYAGCPEGYSEVSKTSGPGYETYRYQIGSFDISYHSTGCCPTHFSFKPGEIKQTRTVHSGTTYGLFVYAPPNCYATSISALSGKQVPMHTSWNSMAWDKRADDGNEFATTVDWNYEAGTLYAHMERVGNTVYMGTHTCYESCDSWFKYYYPDETGAPITRSSKTTGTSARTTVGSGVESGQVGTGDSARSTGTGIVNPTSGVERGYGWDVRVVAMLMVLEMVMFLG